MPVKSATLDQFGFQKIPDLAKELGISESTLRNWIHQGTLPAIREDGVWFTTAAEVARTAASKGLQGPRRTWQSQAEREAVKATA